MSVQSVVYPSGDSLVSTQVSLLEKHGYLFGQKITNSLSPFLHNVIYQHLGLKWGQVRLDSADMAGFLQLIQHRDFYGKKPPENSVIPYELDQILTHFV